jgi:hypothetical protein
LAWLEQLFDRETRKKARRKWRLLILDGHGSHVTMDFISFCDANKILLMVFPPHATHSLQPLDVVMFAPLSSAYSKELIYYLHCSQGLLSVKKGDFFTLFWAAWVSSFKEETVLQSFKTTGIYPMDAEVILKRFNKAPSDNPEVLSSEPKGNGSSWNDLHRLYNVAVKDNGGAAAKELSGALHSLQVHNELLLHENTGLRDALTTKRKRSKKGKTLDLQQRKEFKSAAVFWSPRKIREARARESVREEEEQAEKLRKSETKQLRAAAALYKKQLAAAAKVAREEAKEVKKKERDDKAARLAAARAQKQQEKEAANAQKSLQLSQRGKRAASQKAVPKAKRARRAVVVQDGVEAAEAAPPAPPKQSRTRTIKAPDRYSE